VSSWPCPICGDQIPMGELAHTDLDHGYPEARWRPKPPLLPDDDQAVERLLAAYQWFDTKGWLALPNWGNPNLQTDEEDNRQMIAAMVDYLREGGPR
jgi:hypothetical protein